MKWNFECESERRDYLHVDIVAQCNGFCALTRYAAALHRFNSAQLERIQAAQQTPFIRA
jgi:hypothetical protein